MEGQIVELIFVRRSGGGRVSREDLFYAGGVARLDRPMDFSPRAGKAQHNRTAPTMSSVMVRDMRILLVVGGMPRGLSGKGSRRCRVVTGWGLATFVAASEREIRSDRRECFNFFVRWRQRDWGGRSRRGSFPARPAGGGPLGHRVISGVSLVNYAVRCVTIPPSTLAIYGHRSRLTRRPRGCVGR